MLSLKINKNGHNSINLNKTIKHIVSFVYEKMGVDAKVISDNNSAEINFGNDSLKEDDEYVFAELIIKKRIKIKKEDFESRDKLHSFISTIKSFCEKASEIEGQLNDVDFIRSKLIKE